MPSKPSASAKPAKPGSRRRQYVPAEERRKRILVAAREVFSRTGLKGARTRELAEAAGINQSTLFEHFRSKEELFIAAVVEPLAEEAEQSRKRMPAYAQADSSKDLRSLLEAGMLDNLQGMNDIYPLLVQALYSDLELGGQVYREQIEPLLRARADMIRDRIDDTIDARLLQLASFGMFFAVAMDRAFNGEDQDLADISRQLTDLIIRGVASSSSSRGQTP